LREARQPIIAPLTQAWQRIKALCVKLSRTLSEETGMKLSARNQLKGKIARVQKGRTTGHVQIDIGKGIIITASITNEAIDELKLKKGNDAVAVIKASDVIVGKL